MPDHAELPAVCDACRAELIASLQSIEIRLRLAYCEHHLTLIRATVVNGRIVYWQLDHPVPADAADDVLKKWKQHKQETRELAH